MHFVPRSSSVPRKDKESEFGVEEPESLAAAARSLDPEITQALARGSESAKLIALISSLPNLQLLAVHPSSSCTLFDAHLARLATDGQLFPNLKRIDREWYDTEGGFDLSLLFPGTISGEERDDEDDEEYPGAGTSNVICIALENSKICGQELSRFLRISKGLKYFGFTEGGDHIGYSSCSREEFGCALTCTSQTLEYLSIEWEDGVEENNSTLGSLQTFQHLRMLSVEFHVLLGVDSHASVDLANVLPQTLEQLFLLKGQNSSWTDVEYQQSIERLIRAKSTSSMPALNTIVLQDPEILAPLLTLAARKDIALVSCDPQQLSSYKTFSKPWYPFSEETDD